MSFKGEGWARLFELWEEGSLGCMEDVLSMKDESRLGLGYYPIPQRCCSSVINRDERVCFDDATTL